MQSNFGGVSKVISSLAENIEDKEKSNNDISDVVEENKFKIQFASANVTKNGSEVSGDTSTQIKLHDGKFMMAISDGMGSRTKSQKEQFYSY